MRNALKSFEEFMVHDKKAQRNTIDSYIRDINTFIRQAGPVQAKDIDPGHIQQYLDQMLESGMSCSSVRRASASLKCFFSFLQKEDGLAINPAVDVKVRAGKKDPPEILSPDEIERLVSMPGDSSLKGLRDRCMLGILYATGLKVSELIALDISDVSTLAGYVRCNNARGCRFIRIQGQAKHALEEYLCIRGTDSGALFLNSRGGRMTRQGFWKLLKHYASAAGIKKSITPQTLRYMLALHLYQNGEDRRDIQNILGCSDLSSLHLDTGAVKDKTKG